MVSPCHQTSSVQAAVLPSTSPRTHLVPARASSRSTSPSTVRQHRCSGKFVALENYFHTQQYGLGLRLKIGLNLGLGLGLEVRLRFGLGLGLGLGLRLGLGLALALVTL